jgi:hypothetical protein
MGQTEWTTLLTQGEDQQTKSNADSLANEYTDGHLGGNGQYLNEW